MANGDKKFGNRDFVITLVSVIFPITVVIIGSIWNYSRSDAAVTSKVEQHTEQITGQKETHENDMQTIRESVKDIDHDQRVTDQRQAVVETEVGNLKGDVRSVSEKVDEVRMRQTSTETKLDRVEGDIEEIKVDQKETKKILLRMERRMMEEKPQ